MSQDRKQEFSALAAAFVDGSLKADERAKLCEICLTNEDLRDCLEWQTETHRLLDLAFEVEDDILFQREVMERIHQEGNGNDFVPQVIGKVVRISRRRAFTRWVSIAAAAVVMMIIGSIWWSPSRSGLATLHRGDAADWEIAPPSSDLRAGTLLKLRSGLAEIHFKDGAELILEGPAKLEIQGRDKCRLLSGKASARVPRRAVGFTVESPAGSIVDLGTAFGVEVAEDGITEAKVFEGRVRIDPIDGVPSTIVNSNETFVFGSRNPAKSVTASDSGFVTSMPPPTAKDIAYIHWPMDEGSGLEVRALGSGDRMEPVAGRFQTFGENKGYPGWIKGRFGNALSFNGDGQAVETDHQVPEDKAARTVAFWVRVPEDFDPAQGFGIISWGSLGESGAAWQLSINPYGGDSREGRLRAGMGKSVVVGKTDLRDGKWHHCAVVLYQDTRRSDRFPVLLYVDGEMEATSSKAVYGAKNEDSGESRPIWMGRNLAHGRSRTAPHGTGFFRGALDEVYLFEGALNRAEIGHLIRHNKAFRQ